MNSKTLRVVTLISVVVIGVIVLLLVGKPLSHNLVVNAYFKDGMGLREGAKVRLAGIDIGTVKTIRLRPEAKEAPVEVVMVLAPAYELKIPNDSTASLATAGLLGEAYVQVDASRASGVITKARDCPPVSSAPKNSRQAPLSPNPKH